jgi:hypothetical protein
MGYEPTVIVTESFEPKGIYADPSELRLPGFPAVPVYNEVKNDRKHLRRTLQACSHLDAILKDVDVVLTHDVIYQNAALKHNFAARKIAEKAHPSIKWLHWIHSATSPVTALANLRALLQR